MVFLVLIKKQNDHLAACLCCQGHVRCSPYHCFTTTHHPRKTKWRRGAWEEAAGGGGAARAASHPGN